MVVLIAVVVVVVVVNIATVRNSNTPISQVIFLIQKFFHPRKIVLTKQSSSYIGVACLEQF